MFFNTQTVVGTQKFRKKNFYFGTKEIILLSWIFVTLYEIVIKCTIF